MASSREESVLLRRLLGVECWGTLLGLSGEPAAARLGITCRAALRSSHSEEYWRALCCSGADEGGAWPSNSPGPQGWVALYSELHGEAWMRQARRERLRAALAARGLELRSDSRLCAQYVQGEAVPGGLEGLVNTMSEMAWFFSESTYQHERDNILQDLAQRARDDARAAFLAGEDSSVDVDSYLDRPSGPQLSELAKGRALAAHARWLLNGPAHGLADPLAASASEGLGAVWAGVPETLRPRLREMCGRLARGEEPLLPDGLGRHADGASPGEEADEEAAARRARLRSRAARVRTELEVATAPHVEAIRLFARDSESPGDAEIIFPPTLTPDQRGFLHQLAEQLGLLHESVGEGSERSLVVRKFSLDLDEWVVLPGLSP